MKEYKVIFHIDEMNKWKLLLTNVYNLKQAIKNDFITIEVLANSEAVKFFVQTTFTESDLLKVRELISYSQGKSNDLANQALKKFTEIFKQEQIKNKVYPLLEFK